MNQLAALSVALAGTAWVLFATADERRRTIDVGRVFDAGAPVEIAITRTAADPEALVERRQWVFDLRWDRGDVWLLGARRMDLASPQATPRVMGRFALELYEGATLIERARFDFPMLAVPEATDAGASFTPKLRTRIGVVFPAVDRGTRLELWDRATDRRWSLPWPPQAQTGPVQTGPVQVGEARAAPSDGGRD